MILFGLYALTVVVLLVYQHLLWPFIKKEKLLHTFEIYVNREMYFLNKRNYILEPTDYKTF